jgi:hypothetical protein
MHGGFESGKRVSCLNRVVVLSNARISSGEEGRHVALVGGLHGVPYVLVKCKACAEGVEVDDG